MPSVFFPWPMQPSGLSNPVQWPSTPSGMVSLANGLERKHAVKQVDRLLTNTKLNVWSLFDDWVSLCGR